MTNHTRTAPSGCHWCGVCALDHMQRWTQTAGWHTWTSPTNAQIKARMFTRREAQARR